MRTDGQTISKKEIQRYGQMALKTMNDAKVKKEKMKRRCEGTSSAAGTHSDFESAIPFEDIPVPLPEIALHRVPNVSYL